MMRPRNSVAKQPQSIHDRRHKAIAKFIDLPRPKTAYQKRRVKQVYEALRPIIAGGYNGTYRSKSERSLSIAARSQGISIKGLKAVPFINDGDPNVKLKVARDGRVLKIDPFAIETQITFDPRKLARRGKVYVKELAHRHGPENIWTVDNGAYTMDGRPQDADHIGDLVEQLMLQYGDGTPKTNNHHYKNWLHGMRSYEPTEQIEEGEYRKRRRKRKRATKAAQLRYTRERHQKRTTKKAKQTRRQRRAAWYKKYGL